MKSAEVARSLAAGVARAAPRATSSPSCRRRSRSSRRRLRRSAARSSLTIIARVLRSPSPGRASARSISSPRRPARSCPSGRTKVVQPFETGVVRAIHVQDGQSVKAGDVLIELDPTISDAEREHLRRRSHGRAARRRAAAGGGRRRRRSARRLRSAGRAPIRHWSRPSASSSSTRWPSSAPSSRRSTARTQRKGGRARLARRHHRQARGDDPDPAAARRHPQIPRRQASTDRSSPISRR